MEISSRFIGSDLKEYTTSVTWRDTMNYAASVGDSNPCYLDDERPGGVVAPPMFAVAATWPISERIWDYIEAPDFPREILMTQVHYSEHLEFFRPLRPGDDVKIQGTIAAIMPHRAGTHIVIRFDARDSHGAQVFCEHIGAMLRGVTCLDGGQGAEDLPHVPSCPATDTTVWKSVITIDELAPFVYDACSRIFFPIHTSVKFAHDVGLPGRILQGTATLAFAVRELVNREGGGNPLALRAVSCRFSGMVLPGSDICVELIHREEQGGISLFFRVINAEGREVIRDGHMLLNVL